MAKKRIDVEIGVKNKVAAGLKSAKAALKRFGKSAGRIMKGIAAGAVAAGAAVIALGISFLKAGSGAEETGTKFDQVFSSMVDSANAVADAFAESFGLASTTAKKLLGDTGDLLVGFGFTEKAALELADQTNRLAGDLASFTNIEGGTARASQALTKALVGETEQAKALGIVIRQNSDEFKDSVKQLVEVEGKTLLQAKALTSLKIAFSQTKKAQGDYARTSDGLANSMRLLSERWKGFREQVGLALNKTGIFSKILQDAAVWLRGFGKSEALNEFVEKIGTATQKVVNLIKVMASGSISEAVRTLGDIIRLSFLDGAERAGGIISRSIKDAYRKMISDMPAGRKKDVMVGMFGAGQVQLSERVRERQGLNTTDAGIELKKIFNRKLPGADILSEPPSTSAGKIGLGNIAGSGFSDIKGGASILSTGELFTMMQTGSGAKDSMISEQQKTNEKLDELISISGGVV